MKIKKMLRRGAELGLMVSAAVIILLSHGCGGGFGADSDGAKDLGKVIFEEEK